jgi:hypothetical protein
MARIEASDLAPEGTFKVSFAQGEYEVPFESDDPTVVANALSHPWLTVEAEAREVEQDNPFYEPYLPENEALSSFNSVANDPEEVQAALDEREVMLTSRVAIDAGLDQGEPEFVGPEGREIATTLAGAEEAEVVEEDEPVIEDKPEDQAPDPVAPVNEETGATFFDNDDTEETR